MRYPIETAAIMVCRKCPAQAERAGVSGPDPKGRNASARRQPRNATG